MPRVIFDLSEETVRRLETVAHKTHQPHHELAERAIELYLDTEEWQLSDIEAGLFDAHRENFVSEEQAGHLFRQMIG